MTREEAKEIVEIFTTLNDSRDAPGGICKDELMLYTVINGKPKCISGLLTDGQFREVERKVKTSLKANIDALTYELDSRKITSHMMMGGGQGWECIVIVTRWDINSARGMATISARQHSSSRCTSHINTKNFLMNSK